MYKRQELDYYTYGENKGYFPSRETMIQYYHDENKNGRFDERKSVQTYGSKAKINGSDAVSYTHLRVVHGGEYYNDAVKVDEEVVARVEELAELAPLHNPAHIVGYNAFKAALPEVEHVFVFDTAFHQTLDRERYLYPLPYEYYTDLKEMCIRDSTKALTTAVDIIEKINPGSYEMLINKNSAKS